MPSPELSVSCGLLHTALCITPPPAPPTPQFQVQHVDKCQAEKGSGAPTGNVASCGGRLLKTEASQGVILGLSSSQGVSKLLGPSASWVRRISLSYIRNT